MYLFSRLTLLLGIFGKFPRQGFKILHITWFDIGESHVRSVTLVLVLQCAKGLLKQIFICLIEVRGFLCILVGRCATGGVTTTDAAMLTFF